MILLFPNSLTQLIGMQRLFSFG